MSNSLENTTRRRWPRITLWRFFVLLTVLTLIASLANTVRQAYIADERLEELHGRFGVARTHSPLQPAVRGLQLPDRRQFRFHIVQPKGRRFRLCASLTGINFIRPTFPESEWEIATPDVEELWLKITPRKSGEQYEVLLTLRWEGGSQSAVIPVPADHFVSKQIDNRLEKSISTTGGRPGLTGMWRPNRTPQLIYAVGEHIFSWSGKEPPSSEGLILWLDEVEEMIGRPTSN